jgi:hypothetical protein
MKPVLSNAGVLFSMVVLAACNDIGSPSDDAVSAASRFPDSITVGMGLPPAATRPDVSRPFDTNGSDDLSGLTAHARSEIIGSGPIYLRVTATLVNPGTRSINIAHGLCEPGITASRGSGAPVPVYPANTGCPAALRVQSVPSADSVQFIRTYAVNELYHDDLTPGHYSMRAVLRLSSYTTAGRTVGERVFDVPAGDLDLPEDTRLASSQTIDGLTYVARTLFTTGPADGPVIRALVLVTNTSNIRRYGNYYGACPVSLLVYRSQADRDALPPKPSVLWLTGGCNDNQTKTFALDPGQSWVFSTDIPRESLTGRQPPGHFWFVAQLGPVNLVAGDAEVR